MEQLDTTTSANVAASAAAGAAASFPIAEAPRPDVMLRACLRGVDAISAYLLYTLGRDAISGAGRNQPDNAHSSPGSPSSHTLNNSFASRIQALLEKKLGGLIKRFFGTDMKAPFIGRAGLTRTARLGKSESRIAELKSANNQQALLERIDLLERELADAKARLVPPTPATGETDWIPLVKVSAPADTAHTAESGQYRNTCDETQAGACQGFDLAGRCVLCVGGRAALYPAYRRVVETSGGNLLIYRSPRNGADHLPALLAHADMVVCPVDCVNHYTYFTVKRYCKRSGKPCVLLDRSGLPTFCKGVATLSALAASPPGHGKLSMATP
ncbi:DUF2325 domain-containing protein [Nitrosovibrio sp. Nv4]|uniref:DUF2325 domain-containing protein n=1 Tax=Nitrosovibrio sp. Nv4 TaxID=1945880 RepID=UPI000BD80D61|nr:DUF2325 domain-containing protein [Nitrosovibrio sp. Nv4]SOD39845.1 hypothetical protein SAMN06298226_0076 [Nitrosovibrio sp. Nv4]